MAAWQPEEYLRFEDERTRPCRDLVNRIEISPRTVIDLGCGPGNSTAVLAQRWPAAEVTGLDSSEAMLRLATSGSALVRWMQQDIVEWLAQTERQFDLVFSNAALQWVGDHAMVFPSLMRRVASGGVLAVQVPADVNAPAHRIMRERFAGGQVREWFVHEPMFYYEVLSAYARRIHLWTTEYLHVLPSVEAIAEWYRSTGLRPFPEALPDDGQRDQFMRDYIMGLRQEFHSRQDGRVLFPFSRLFIVAER